MTEYTKRLDRTRDHGTYHPPENGAFYNQDGFDFDHEGRIVEALLSTEQREQLAKKSAAVATPSKAKTKAKAAAEVEDDPPAAPDHDTEDGLNLELWLRGEEDYPFPDVQQAVRTRFNTWKTGKRDLVLFLVDDQKLIDPEDLSDEFKAMVG